MAYHYCLRHVYVTQELPRVTQFLDLTYKYGLLSLSKTCVHDAGSAARDAIPGPNIQAFV
jgi:hypothetical protein